MQLTRARPPAPAHAPKYGRAITPGLTLVPTTVNAGATQSLGFDLAFAPTTGDSPKSVVLTLPAGLIPDATINGGACLGAAAPTAGCQVASGMATLGGAAPTAVSVWLVKGPSASDLAGAALVQGATATGTVIATADVTFATGQVTLSFTSLPNLALSELDLTLTNLRAPTSCPVTPAAVGVSATSALDPTAKTASAPLSVTGCASLPFSPTLTATATKDSTDSSVAVTTSVTQPAGQAADKMLTLTVPASLSPNVASATAVFNKGTSVGTATATSPLLPGTLTGTVTLTGTSLLSPNLTLTFPAPFPIVLQGAINLNNNSVTFANVPDVPLSNLGVNLSGGAQALYETTCSPSTVTLSGNFTDQNGDKTVPSSSTVVIANCPTSVVTPPGGGTVGAPTASGSALGGLVKNKAKLGFTVSEGTNAKPIKTIAVSLPKGIIFASKAKSLKKGIAVKSAGKFTYKVSKGVLTITLASPAVKATVTLKSPAISVSSKLAKSVKKELKKKKVAALNVKIKVTDSGGTATTLKLPLKPRS